MSGAQAKNQQERDWGRCKIRRVRGQDQRDKNHLNSKQNGRNLSNKKNNYKKKKTKESQ
jgi:hypothetical protein